MSAPAFGKEKKRQSQDSVFGKEETGECPLSLHFFGAFYVNHKPAERLGKKAAVQALIDVSDFHVGIAQDFQVISGLFFGDLYAVLLLVTRWYMDFVGKACRVF